MNERDEFVTYFRRVQPQFSRFFASVLIDANLTLPQYALLNVLDQTGVMSMTEMGEKLHVSKPAVTNLVDRLEKAKYLKRLPHSSDRRVYLLEIQQKGKILVRKIQAYLLKLLLSALDQFSVSERKVITRFYASLSKKMDEFLLSVNQVKE